ncbi:hypothetical protein [Methanolacinia paynteri]|uniref:hypothetical protein n=1 Tax=Methanolacinia paynteri TaxID=230356 RepID=UPI00064E5E36|nr:hypothetical protein [Methanolacinia paynteri]
MKYAIPEISAKAIVQCIEALSKKEGDIGYLCNYLKVGKESIRRVIVMGNQLNFFLTENGLIKLSPNCSSLIKHLNGDYTVIFKEALFHYKPFILICDYILNDENPEEAVRKTKVVFDIDANPRIIIKTMNNFCKYIGISGLNKEEILKIVPSSKTQYSNINKVINTINDQISAEIFLSDKLGQNCYANIIDPERKLLCDSLIKISNNPSNAIDDAAGAFESYLRRVGNQKGIDLTDANGIDEIGQRLGSKKIKVILTEHQKMCSFIGTFRNPAIHKVHKLSLDHWIIEKDSAAEIILLMITCMRSIHFYVNEGGIHKI